MRYLSVCSGIEAASVAWHSLGWSPVAFSEIEPFPCAVLAHHYPSVPNWGDMTRFHEWPDADVDVLVGGTPCQSFSVAGLRKGLADPRGNLALTFLAIADRYQPRDVIWENVPGVLSDSTDALPTFLDGLAGIGYAIVGFDILDAQFFGLAQRRRRVFVWARRIDALLSERTTFSALIAAQLLAEIWRDALAVLCGQLNPGQGSSGWQSSASVASLRKKIESFGLLEDAQAWKLLDSLAALLPSSECEPGVWGSPVGSSSSQRPPTTGVTRSARSEKKAASTGESLNTELSWKNTLADGLQAARLCITSTGTKETIESRIFTCAQAAMSTSRFMRGLTDSSPNFSHAAASCLTALLAYIEYARHTSTDLFGDVGRIRWWGDFISEAERASHALGHIGRTNFGQVLPLSESLRGDSPPRREAGQGVANSLTERPDKGGGNSEGQRLIAQPLRAGRQYSDMGDGQSNIVAAPLGAKDGSGYRQDLDNETYVTHALRAEGFDASEDGTGRGIPLVPDTSFCLTRGGQQRIDAESETLIPIRCGFDEVAATPETTSDDYSRSDGFSMIAFAQNQREEVRELEVAGALPSIRRGDAKNETILAFDTTQVTSAANYSNPKPGDPCHPLASGQHPPAIAFDARQSDVIQYGDKTGPLDTDGHSMAVAVDLRNGAESDEAMALQAGGMGSERGRCINALPNVRTAAMVRRLTPVECARLQGFPDNYLDITYRGKPAADGPKYKALGNSMAVPVMHWIGRRIAWVEDYAGLLEEGAA